ncbi:hypothetical protein HDV06_002010 [Boothiomyces sp. JEL0866]|nr:hypothetical protein HDV06_002010 [Boothiomyces sp. JEL0866]
MFKEQVALGIWLIICSGSFLGIVITQLYIKVPICLLHVKNYHLSDYHMSWIFDTDSYSCYTPLSLGAICSVFFLVVAAIHVYHIRNKKEYSYNDIKWLLALSTTCTLFSLVSSIWTVSGMTTTCYEFQKNGKSCALVLHQGFFITEYTEIFRKDLNIIYFGIAASCVATVLWFGYAIFIWNKSKSDNSSNCATTEVTPLLQENED